MASPGDAKLSLPLGTTRGSHSPAGAGLAGRRPNFIWETPQPFDSAHGSQQAAGNASVFNLIPEGGKICAVLKHLMGYASDNHSSAMITYDTPSADSFMPENPPVIARVVGKPQGLLEKIICLLSLSVFPIPDGYEDETGFHYLETVRGGAWGPTNAPHWIAAHI